MPLAISVTQAGPGPIRGLAPAASPLRRPRPVGAARVIARTADMGEDTTKLWKEIALSLWEKGDREAVGEGELIRYRTFETVNLGKDPGQNGKNEGTNPSNSCIIINMTQKTNLEQT